MDVCHCGRMLPVLWLINDKGFFRTPREEFELFPRDSGELLEVWPGEQHVEINIFGICTWQPCVGGG